ncbi:MAG: alpha-E domain-containing protein, partial [Hyphomicrobium sp.]
MLGRTANDLYWLARYVERAENMARLIEVGYRIALLPRDVINYLLFDCNNSSSVKACLSAARRNGRAQRTSLTRDM